MPDYWIGISVLVEADDENHAGNLAEDIADVLEESHHGVIEARWDNNPPEEDVET